ncbi:MAG: DUF1616 domain-containing protein [Thermoplasmata archaeon]
MAANPAEILLGVLLVFFLPGFGVVVATFPEWRFRGRSALERGLTTVTLSIVLSVALTVLVGYGLLALSPSGFAASWTNPTLEIGLGLIAILGLGVGWLRGSFSRTPPPAARPEPDEIDPYALARELDRLRREWRQIRARERHSPVRSDRSDARPQMEALESEIRRIESDLEREYVQ